MTQHPHDEFDDVPPYKSDEVGKHRAPGSPAAAAGGARGGLKWIGLLAAFVLVIGAIAYVVSQFGSDEEGPTAESEDQQTAGAEETGEPEAQNGEGTDGEGSDGDAQNGETAEDGEEETPEETPDVDMDYGLIVYNYDGTPGVAGSVREQLDSAGFNVVDQQNWTQGWTTCEESAPVVVHPPAEEELAAVIADELGAATCASDGWSDAEVIAVVVGADSLP